MSYLIRRVLAKPRLIFDEMCRLYGKFTSYLRRVLCKTRLIFPRINGPNVIILLDTKVDGIEWLGNLPSITNEDCVLSVKSVFFPDFINRSFLRALLKNFSMTFLFPVFLTVLFFEHSRTAYDVIANSTVVVTSAAPLRQQGNQLNQRQ